MYLYHRYNVATVARLAKIRTPFNSQCYYVAPIVVPLLLSVGSLRLVSVEQQAQPSLHSIMLPDILAFTPALMFLFSFGRAHPLQVRNGASELIGRP